MSIKKFIAIVVAIVVGAKLFEMFLWQTPVELGKDTTYITEPLAEDGLPNYALAILQQQREGVTAENNAAIGMWRALGPVDLDKHSFERVCSDLSMAHLPAGPFLEPVDGDTVKDRIVQWLRSSQGEESEKTSKYDAAAEAIVQSFYDRPWTAAESPPMADWVGANQGQLDALVAAAAKPRFYSAPPNLLEDATGPLIAMLLPHAQYSRLVARALLVRANHRTANGELDAAWHDLLGCWRLGELVGRGPSLMERIVGIALRGITMRGTIVLLESPRLSGKLSRQVLADLTRLSLCIEVTSALDRFERFSYLDVALRVTAGRFGGLKEEDFAGLAEATEVLRVKVDTNTILRRANKWYDELTNAVSHEDRLKRRLAMDQLEGRLHNLGNKYSGSYLSAILSRRKRSELISDLLIAYLTPAARAALAAQDRDQTNACITRVAAAIAVYRADKGEYPENLDALAEIAALPVDPYNNRPFVYERRGDGYVLYSVFENGIDDGGDDLGEPIVDGEWLPFDKQKDFEPPGMENSDLVIRVPLPPLPSIEALIESQNISGEE